VSADQAGAGTDDRTWRRFTGVVAVAGAVALAIGMTLSYASLYRMAYNAGFDDAWIRGDGWTLRPAHLFPLTLDVPILVGYAGMIALAGRRSVGWAKLVLVACSVATVAAQIVDGAGWVTEHAWIQALIHGWPPALALMTGHLFVKIVQALGYLVPPVAEPTRRSWVARSWAWVVRLRADIRTTPDVPTDDHTQGDIPNVTRPDTDRDTRGDIGPDAHADTQQDIDGDSDRTSDGDNTQVSDQFRGAGNVTQFAGAKGRLIARALDGEITQAEAARRAKVSPKTMGRWVKDARAAREARSEAAR
jgi:hypothetical protein